MYKKDRNEKIYINFRPKNKINNKGLKNKKGNFVLVEARLNSKHF